MTARAPLRRNRRSACRRGSRRGVPSPHRVGRAAKRTPIAAGVVRTAEKCGLTVPESSEFEAITGRGVSARVDWHELRVLSPGAMKEEELSSTLYEGQALEREGKTVVCVIRGDTIIGALVLVDVIRDSSQEAVDTLHAVDIEAVMLTGDRQAVADWMAMMGDGVNDAPASSPPTSASPSGPFS